jgi:gamma-tubulin complex component 5
LLQYRLAKKAKVQSHDELASAIDLAYKNAKDRVLKNVDLDDEIKVRMAFPLGVGSHISKISRLPDHLQLLVLLSNPPQLSTLALAESYLETAHNPIAPTRSLTWQDILTDEPFEGQHWEGAYGLLPGSTVENWENRSSGSTPSLSLWDDDSDEHGEDFISPTGSEYSLEEGEPTTQEFDVINHLPMKVSAQPFAHRNTVEELKARQYWRPEWCTDIDTNRSFSLGDPSTLGIN